MICSSARFGTKIEREYSLDKYGALLKRFGDVPISVEEVRRAQFDVAGKGQMCVSKGRPLYTCPLTDARNMERQLVLDALRSHATDCSKHR